MCLYHIRSKRETKQRSRCLSIKEKKPKEPSHRLSKKAADGSKRLQRGKEATQTDVSNGRLNGHRDGSIGDASRSQTSQSHPNSGCGRSSATEQAKVVQAAAISRKCQILVLKIKACGERRKWTSGRVDPRTDETEVGGETTHYHLPGRVSRASADSTAHSFFILDIKSEIVNLQEKGITLHTSVGAIEFSDHVYSFQQADL